MSDYTLSRRRFIRDAGSAAAAAGVLGAPSIARSATRRSNGKAVAVLGGGMAGLAAAHELVERGFDVTVYERNALGGKARSIPVAGTAKGGRRGLPGEHGFRFFPGFYHHVPDTMRRIPFAGNAHGVWDNLVAATEGTLAAHRRPARRPVFGIAPDPDEALHARGAAAHPHRGDRQAAGRPRPHELAYFVNRADGLPHELRRAPLRPVGEHRWWDFVARRGPLRRVQEGPRRAA